MSRWSANPAWAVGFGTAAAVLLLAAAAAQAQSGNTTEVFGTVPAAQVAQSLGINLAAGNEWEFAAASSAHITWGRFDCAWASVEKQVLPQNTSGGYALPKACADGLGFARKYGVHPIVDALFGAPSGRVATAFTVGDSPAGSTRIQLSATSGSISSAIAGQSYVKFGNVKLSSKGAYPGTLIAGNDGQSIQLASALTADLPAHSQVMLNLQLYPPVLIAPGTTYTANRSIQAYGNYVHFLQTQVAASGIAGRVSIWNEPPWGGDPWDEAANLYDNPPPEARIKPKFGIELAFYAAGLPLVQGALLDNGYTNKTANGSLLMPVRANNLPDFNGARQAFASESFHPYGNNPEDGAWIPSCVKTHGTQGNFNQVLQDCTPTGMVTGSNMKLRAAYKATHVPAPGLDMAITETGLCRCTVPAPTETQIARFNLRQFLVYSGLDVHPILFYRLAGNPQFEWLHTDHSPYPVFTAFQKLMDDIQTIALPPVAPSPSCPVPAVESYSGAYPLATVVLVGARAGERANSYLLYSWQRSYSPTKWTAVPSPPAADAIANFPGTLKVAGVKDTVSGSEIPFQVNGHTVHYPVSDNPIQILFTPVAPGVTQTCSSS